jgi:hypothetical protein
VQWWVSEEERKTMPIQIKRCCFWLLISASEENDGVTEVVLFCGQAT